MRPLLHGPTEACKSCRACIVKAHKMTAITEHSLAKDNAESQCRWSSYENYRLILWVWMMNEMTVMFSPTEISHNGFYFHALVQALSVIFIGIPLVYSEICIAQYTNCDILSMWNFFPLFRYVGLGTLYLIILKTAYVMVLTSWYLEYTFYAALDPPPWFSCDSFNTTKCMVKSVNVSIFQHCLEAQLLFDYDCGMKTASNCFFEREIGDNNTYNSRYCVFQWKGIIACTSLSILLFIVSIKKVKLIQVYVRLLAFYVLVVILVLFCVALSTSGTWYATIIEFHWSNIDIENCYNSITRGIISLGTGTGIIIFLSRDVPFRSPATMTAICTPLFSLISTIMLALVSFSGIKTMSFFHGEEENVIEIGFSMYFSAFASVSEIMTYFDATSLWGFFWFSAICFCLFANLWILHIFLSDILMAFRYVRTYRNISGTLLIFVMCVLSWPFLCADLTGALTDATELIQVMNNILFSVSFYWIYGYNNHNVDIVFMIGVKSKYYWNIAWFLNPIILFSILYYRWIDLKIRSYGDSLEIDIFSTTVHWLLFYTLIGIYFIIIFLGILIQFINYLRQGNLQNAFKPTEFWGPSDLILFKSRKMFVPEIMTTEFLYRQVRMRGYYGSKKRMSKFKTKSLDRESVTNDNIVQWSALTSN